MKRFLCVLLCVAMIMSCMGTAVFADTVTPLISGLDDYCHYSTSLANDGYIGIPVDICTYYKAIRRAKQRNGRRLCCMS